MSEFAFLRAMQGIGRARPWFRSGAYPLFLIAFCVAAGLAVSLVFDRPGSAREGADRRGAAGPTATFDDSLIQLARLPDATEPLEPESPATVSRILVVEPGDALMPMMRRAGIPARQAAAAIAAMRSRHDPAHIAPGQKLAVAFTADETGQDAGAVTLREVALALAPDRTILVTLGEDRRFRAEEIRTRLTRRLVGKAETIDSSLYLAGKRADIPAGVLHKLVRLYSWDLDFQRDIRQGDAFTLAWNQEFTDDGVFARDGEIVFARLMLSGREKPYYRFETAAGAVYLDSNGKGARKPLMLTPIDGARLSSSYGSRRHPILGYTHMHRGVDFAAPAGTPIYAAGDGRIVAIGRNGAYGKYIRIRHNARYQTAYAHMRAFRRGLRKGSRVEQGQVIGYVGSTGRSTGPHLHYEILVNGRQVNPRRVKLTPQRVLKGEELARFRVHRAKIDRRVAALLERPLTDLTRR